MASGCVILVPYLSHIEPACERGLRALEERGYPVWRTPASAAIDRVRCEIATRALATGFEELMWIDSDIAFNVEAVEQLRGHRLPLVSGLYAKRGHGDFACHFAAGTKEVGVGERGGVLEVRYVGAGFLLTQRSVYADIQARFSLPLCNVAFGAPAVPYFLPMVLTEPDHYWYLSEDFSFCERARVAGHRVLVDTVIRLGHVGKYTYEWEDAATTVPRVAAATFKLDGTSDR